MKNRPIAIYLLIAAMLLAVFGTSCSSDHDGAEAKPNKIILLIGDGMGGAQVSYAYMMGSGGSFRRFTHSGFSITRSTDSWITDSAAGATALSTGVKTYNGAIGVGVDYKPLKTIVEYAEEKGWSTGLVATSSVTHATPAAFAAHVRSRSMEYAIAKQLVDSGVDVIIGGGSEYFLPEEEGGSRKDGKNLVNEFENEDGTIIYNISSLNALDTEFVRNLLALIRPKHLDRRKNPEDRLDQMTAAALAVLDNNEKGFFLMVEGSQIDWAGHERNTDYLMHEMKDFNDAIDVALDYASTHEGVLVLLTADHECGGLTLHPGNKKIGEFSTNWSTGGHTGEAVPVFTFGVGADRFGGLLEIEEIGQKLLELVK